MLWIASICRRSPKVPLISPHRRPIKPSNSNRTETAEPRTRLREKRGKSELKKGDDLMKSKRRSAALLSILCAGLVAMFLGGCADTPYVAYGPGYYPAGYYTGYSYDYDAYPYSYYGPAYESTVVRSGVRYNDAYGPRYYRTRTVYGDW
jgi:hypothetical protein